MTEIISVKCTTISSVSDVEIRIFGQRMFGRGFIEIQVI